MHESESESEVVSRVQLCATPWTAAYQAPPSMGFSRQEYWSGVLNLYKVPQDQLGTLLQNILSLKSCGKLKSTINKQ